MRISDAVQAAKPYVERIQRGELKPLPPQPPIARPAPILDPAGGLSAFSKCPAPPLNVAPDSLRQFYRIGIPQRRVIGLAPLTA